MLWFIDGANLTPVTKIPYRETWDVLVSRLSRAEITAVEDEVNRRIDASGDIVMTGWSAGSDWTDCPFEIVYDVAARQDFELAGKMLGLFYWAVVMQREDDWSSGRYEKDGVPISSRTYFKISTRAR